MYDLALHQGSGPISLKSVAERQGISEHYLEQLMGSLRKAGYVRSVRGAQGGYQLTKKPEEISVGDIVRAMEGPIAPVDCLLGDADDNNPHCKKAASCIRRGVWAKMQDSINHTLDEISLADMCRDVSQSQILK